MLRIQQNGGFNFSDFIINLSITKIKLCQFFPLYSDYINHIQVLILSGASSVLGMVLLCSTLDLNAPTGLATAGLGTC